MIHSVGDQIEFKPYPGVRGWWRGKVAAALKDGKQYTVTTHAGQSYIVPAKRVRTVEAKPERRQRSLGPMVAPEGTRTVTTGRRASARARPKNPPQRSEDYLAFVRRHVCVFALDGDCLGTVEAAHGPGPRGLGQKTDDFRCFPACTKHHAEIHTTGTGTFAMRGAIAQAQVDLLVEWLSR